MSRAIVLSLSIIILGALFLQREKGLFSFQQVPSESFNFSENEKKTSKPKKTNSLFKIKDEIESLDQGEAISNELVEDLSDNDDLKFFSQEENDERINAVREDMIKSGFSQNRIDQLLSNELKRPVYYFNGNEDEPEILYEGRAVESLPEDQKSSGLPILGRGAIQALSSRSSNAVRGAEAQEITGSLISRDAYSLFRFIPGTVLDGVTKIEQEGTPRNSVKGPDHPIDISLPSDTSSKEFQSAIDDIRTKSLSLGDKGEVILKIQSGGQIFNGRGADFSIFGTLTFELGNIERNPALIQIAQVGVAWNNDEAEYKWFPCNVEKLRLSELRGCAGIKSQQSGGDQFDLALIGVNAARFVKIRDAGNNVEVLSEEDREVVADPTAGFDLDAMVILNGRK